MTKDTQQCSRCQDYYGTICHFCGMDHTVPEAPVANKEVRVASRETPVTKPKKKVKAISW